MRPQDRWPLGAIGFVLLVSVLWWGFALFAVPGAPEWLSRARAVCFNVTETGLPDAKGWLLLIGQPPAMLAALYAGWASEVRDTLGHLRSLSAGRNLIGGTVTLVLLGLSLASIRVADARIPEPTLDAGGIGSAPGEPLPETYPRVDRAWPASAMAGLVDQRGTPFTLESLGGREAFVTFAFGHCRTICPMVVHSARGARLERRLDLAVVVFTLDPWRDTPSRSGALMDQWMLDPERDFVVTGPVDAVNAALDALDIPRERDLQTGDIIHPSLVYVMERDGTLAYASTGVQSHLEQLVERLR